MKPKTMILMVVAVVCGLAASYMTSRLLADKGTPPPVATVTVLVAKQKINAWTPIKNPEDLFVTNLVGETFVLYRNDGRGNFEDIRIPSGLAALTAAVTGFATEFFEA